MPNWTSSAGAGAMFQNYIQNSTRKVIECLEMALAELVSFRQNVLSPDFILLALLSQSDS